MLKTLLKYEWKATWKFLVSINLFIILITIIGIISFELGMWNWTNDTLIAIAIFAYLFYIIAISAAGISTSVYLYIRFYKTMYTDEGYLTHTLPVSANMHIISKLLIAVFWTMVSSTVMLISVIILLIYIMAALSDAPILETFLVMTTAFSEFNINISGVLFAIELIVITLISSFGSILMGYVAISIGQLVQKHKIGTSILIYFGFYMAMQTVCSIIMLPMMTISIVSGTSSFYLFNSVVIATGIVYAILSVVLYFVILHITKKKLNLD